MIFNIIDKLKTNLRIKQATILFSVNIFSIPLSFISSILITRYLGPIDFGNYTFLLNIFGLAVIVYDFGFFQAGNRALVLNNDKSKAREYYGALLFCLIFLSIIMGVSMLVYAHYDNNLSSKGLASTFILLIPFGWIFLLPRIYETLFQADNRINDLAISRILPAICNLLSVSLAYYILDDKQYNLLNTILSLYLTSNVIVFIILLFRIKPSIGNLKQRLREIGHYTKIYGFHVYSGSVFAVSMSQLSGILISYFALNNSGVGHFALSLAFSMPLKLIPNTIATTHYRDFSEMISIPKKLTSYTIIISITSLVFLSLIISPIVNLFYGESFIPVIKLTIISSIGMLFYGMADYVNRFLGAHGRGKLLRNSAIMVGLTLLIANITLISFWGEMGAVLAQLISGFVYLGNMLMYYKLYINNKKIIG